MKENARILVMDDDCTIGKMLKILLEKEGYHVMVSQKPDETETIIKENDINLLLLDICLMDVNGLDVCVRLKKNNATKHVPILMMSTICEGAPKSKAAGANDFVAKPFGKRDLLSKARAVLNHE